MTEAVAEELAAADLLLHLCPSEPFGLAILEAIKAHMPAVRRISSYCLPRNLRKKSQVEVNELAAAGLSMVYVGAESGDDQVLAAVHKGETFEATREADALHLSVVQAAGANQGAVENVLSTPGVSPLADVPKTDNMRDLEREHILETLATVGGSRKLAGERLGMSERTLRHKLKQYREAGLFFE